MTIPKGYRRCSGVCHKLYALNKANFHSNGNGDDGLRHECKTCLNNRRRLPNVMLGLKLRQHFAELYPGRCGICGEPMETAYRGRWICDLHKYQKCEECDYGLVCIERWKAALNVVCELQTDDDLLRAWVYAEGERLAGVMS